MAEPFEVKDDVVAKMKDAVKNEQAGAAQAILQEVGPCGFDSLINKTDKGLIADYNAQSGDKTVPPLIVGSVREMERWADYEYAAKLVHVEGGLWSVSLGTPRDFASYKSDDTCKTKR